jgi:hypothetical protein
MPLSCDCYGGCWGVHSKNWPHIKVTPEDLTPFKDSHHPVMSFLHAVTKGHTLIPYGSYVISDKEIRVETEEYKAWLLEAISTFDFV